jgi:endonuclease/exonuclease/phosphatase (EEP) superfamily protein YafD
MPSIKGVVIGGDFNTNHDQDMFAAERTLDCLAAAGYQNGFEGLPLPERVTHPGTHGFPDATFDYVFANGLTASRPTVDHSNASDHWPRDAQFPFALKRASSAVFAAKKQCSKLRGARDYTGT